ncbi:hypothetical protein G6F31_014621 [Rhizopus arrhizus]|nr:hypothetical protein G6F31_014621 [Rhizopus arrhizus]
MGRGPSIEARKNASDAKRGKIFTKIIREIGVAARGGGGDPNNNPRLRVAMDKGLAVNMSKDVIERAIKKATGELEGVDYEEIRYEGYAPGGVAVIVDCLTDNRVRTVADVRHAFSKCGGNMGTEGSVAFMFKRLGVLSFAPGADEEAITEAAIEAGADDIVVYPDDGAIDVVTSPDAFNAVKDAMAAAGHVAGHAEITFRADNDIKVEGEVALQVKKLLDMLEDLDDVQDVASRSVPPGVRHDPHPRHRPRFAADRGRHHRCRRRRPRQPRAPPAAGAAGRRRIPAAHDAAGAGPGRPVPGIPAQRSGHRKGLHGAQSRFGAEAGPGPWRGDFRRGTA